MRAPRIIGMGMVSIAVALAGLGQVRAAGERVVVDGSSTVFRISRAAQEEYSKVKPDVTVVVNIQGTGGGFRNYLAGKTDIVDASRPANKVEMARIGADPKLACTRFTVGYDGITVVVNPKNDFVKSLTVEQLKKLWEPNSKIRTWADLDPAWPKRSIKLYCPDNASGTFDYFTEAIVGKEKAQRKDVNASPDDNVIVNGVAKDADGLGYFGYAYYKANARKIRDIPIQNGPSAQPVEPSHDTILDGTYAPLSRPLFIYVKHSSFRQPATAGFVDFYLKNVAKLAEKGGYVAPTKADIAANQKARTAAGGAPAPAAR